MDPAELVWYVGYGSNLDRSRFMVYLCGGRIAGNGVVHVGCADTSPPLDDVPVELPHSLYFAGWTDRAWGGTSAAFVTVDRRAPPALARAYLIRRGQFLDVARQESANRSDVDDFDLALVRARRGGHARLLPAGAYSELVWCGERDGRPLVSFTAPTNRTDFGPPSEAYLRVIGQGLRECHGLTTTQAAAYLARCPGVQGHWTPDALQHVLGTNP